MTIAKKNKNQCSDTSTTARIIFRSAMTFSSSFSPSSPLTEDNKTTANVNNNQTFLRSTAMVSTSPEVLSLLHGSKVNLVSHSVRLSSLQIKSYFFVLYGAGKTLGFLKKRFRFL